MDKTAAERMRRYRNRQRNETVTDVTLAVTEAPKSVTADVTVYPAIVEALANPEKRRKLERIVEELGKRGLEKEVRYGIAGPTFDVVGELLEVTCATFQSTLPQGKRQVTMFYT